MWLKICIHDAGAAGASLGHVMQGFFVFVVVLRARSWGNVQLATPRH